MELAGIDLGGTKMLVIYGDRVWRFPTGVEAGPETIAAHWRSVQAELPSGVRPALAVPGLVDAAGVVADCDVLPRLVGWDPGRELDAAAVLNDGEAALEAVAAEEPPEAVVVAVGCGTGLVAAVRVAGQSLRSWRPWAGELGLAPWGETGTFDSHASGAALLRETALGAAALTAALERAEPGAVQAVRRAGEAFGAALATLVQVIHPERIGLYGGTLRYPGYLEAAFNALERRTHPLMLAQCRVAMAANPELAVAQGARLRASR